jgi:ATP-binding cassette, subfamily B, multidrug efflux pump
MLSLHQLLRQFAKTHWVNYCAAAAMLLGIVGLNAWIPRRIGEIVDALAKGSSASLNSPSAVGSPLDALLQSLAWLVVAALLIYFMRAGWRLFLFRAVYKLGVQLRTQLYQQLCLQTPGFYQNQRTGDLMAAATNDIDAIEMAAGEGALAGFDGVCNLVIMTAALTLAVDFRITLAIFAPMPIMAFLFWKISNKIHFASRESLDSFGRMNDQVLETLQGVRTVRALGLLDREKEEFRKRAQRTADASLSAQNWEAAYEPSVGTCLTVASVLSLGVGTWLVQQNQLTVGQLTSVGLYLGQMIWPMFALGWVLSLMQRGTAAWERLQPLLQQPVTVLDEGQQSQLPLPHLKFNRVNFAYPQQTPPALNDIELELQAGKSLAIVGPTGSGKSTLLKLLLRQWQPMAGNITWGAHTLSDYQLNALRSQIAWVAQEPFLFSASVASNIGLAAPKANREQIIAAAKMAAVHDDIERLPHGYDTPVGERGVTLSGGQKQRVAIARALLTSAPLLLLDDALSAVDTETESQILRSLAAETIQRTVVVISHRLSSVVNADQIVVLRHGKIVERGNHGQLVDLQGWYARQWQFQQLQASLDAEA